MAQYLHREFEILNYRDASVSFFHLRSCPYWEVGCSPTSSDGVAADHAGADDAPSASDTRPAVVVGQISTILIIVGVVAFVVFFVVVGAVIRKRQTTLVVRTGDDDPPSSGTWRRGERH